MGSGQKSPLGRDEPRLSYISTGLVSTTSNLTGGGYLLAVLVFHVAAARARAPRRGGTSHKPVTHAGALAQDHA